jgi:hypothetical protein
MTNAFTEQERSDAQETMLCRHDAGRDFDSSDWFVGAAEWSIDLRCLFGFGKCSV